MLLFTVVSMIPIAINSYTTSRGSKPCPDTFLEAFVWEGGDFSSIRINLPTGQIQQLLDERTVENKGKLILTEIFPSE